MKVMLVTPASAPAGERWMPLGLCHIASALERDGHEVKIFDRYLTVLRSNLISANESMVRELHRFSPDIVGFSTYTPCIYDTIEAIRTVRAISGARILLGGHHATVFPELTLQRIPDADAVITGEAETAFCLYAAGTENPNIPGLYWRENGIRHSSVPQKPENLDDLPLPAYHLIDMAYYTGKNIDTIRPYYLSTGSILSSRGCRNRCTYCTESLTYTGGPRAHNLNYVFNTIGLLRDTYKCDGITFLDSDFLVDRKRSEEIMLGIIARRWNRDMIFCAQVRADDIDDDIANLLKEAGFRKVEIGLETSSQASLDMLGKNLQAITSENAVRICRRHGISVQANLMYGLEGETIAALDATLDWIKKLKVQNVKWGKIQLFPGSQLYRQKGGDFFENNEWTRENVERFFRTDHLSGIPYEDWKRWRDERLKPYLRFTYHRGNLMHNPLGYSLKYYSYTIARKLIKKV